MGNSLVPMASKRCCGLTMGRVRRLEFVSDQCSTRLQKKTVFGRVLPIRMSPGRAHKGADGPTLVIPVN